MKAMILAAGRGTRLRPYTNDIPKPLFSIAGRPLLDYVVQSLIQGGCEAIIINTHHLPEQIDAFIAAQNYRIPVYTRFEPEILGTGGAIRNVADFWDERPFLVVNGDVLSTIELKKVYQFHRRHDSPATLALYDDPEINTVSVDANGFIIDFGDPSDFSVHPSEKKLTFTGIQVLDPEILDYIPASGYSNSIDAFKKMMAAGKGLKGFISRNEFWNDIGTPARYTESAIHHAVPEAFKQAYSDYRNENITQTRLRGDGSERRWYRLDSDGQTLIMVDHGIHTAGETTEVDSFIHIGGHLYAAGIPVPQIYYHDRFAGLVFLQDLGNTDLQSAISRTKNHETIISWYKQVIDLLIALSIKGAMGFDLAWTYQTPRYDEQLILERECRYFVEAFLNGYFGWKISVDKYAKEFKSLAHKALERPIMGFMHRDMQSRNIMFKDKQFYFIDFQGGRIGPLQYDLASLLIDPYVKLPHRIQSRLLTYCIKRLLSYTQVEPAAFRRCYEYCALTRNLQILGAFGYLSTVKGKNYFKKYIPPAVRSLRKNLSDHAKTEFPGLMSLVEKIPNGKSQ
jgi:aminoglycoside/choline kinase family phosphotransferase/GTP:adenosylcobinamide-phosphate guanylyltransferase